MVEFAHKVALITGGGSGIGAALGRALAAEGARVAVADIHLESARATAEQVAAAGGSAIALQLDVTRPEECRSAVAETERRLGPIDILCSNAGVVGAVKPLTELPVDYMRWLYEVNVFGGMNAIQAVVPKMQARGAGHVLITASMAGFGSLPRMGDYCSSKHAMIALAEVLRLELAGSGVGVSVLCPAAVSTGLSDTTRRQLPGAFAQALDIDGPLAQSIKAAATEKSGGVMTADEAASIALAALRRDQFYIFTHAAGRERASARAREADEAFDLLEPSHVAG